VWSAAPPSVFASYTPLASDIDAILFMQGRSIALNFQPRISLASHPPGEVQNAKDIECIMKAGVLFAFAFQQQFRLSVISRSRQSLVNGDAPQKRSQIDGNLVKG
jgi:hypothetical protein